MNPTPVAQRAENRTIALWLMLCCALVFVMVVVGGVTRLTKSGLSIVEWEPLIGAIPPLSEADWRQMFHEYQQTPEYQKVNRGMSLDAFKGIFWWEYIHRLLGRIIGLVFFIPLLYFVVRRRIERALVPRMAGIFALGMLQGAIGWWMVKSGLVDDPRVSHFRLTTHLGMAFVIFAAMFWTALSLLQRPCARITQLSGLASGIAVMVMLQVLSGGLVAGSHAGWAYNTFPDMNGHLVPPEAFALTPWWQNFLHTIGAIQFLHRCLAWVLLIMIIVLWWRSRAVALSASTRLAVRLLAGMVIVQFILGVTTLLMRVPVHLGAAHQGGALVLFALALWAMVQLRGTSPSEAL